MRNFYKLLSCCLLIVGVLFINNASGQAPNISYTTNALTYTVGTAITSIIPINAGGAVPASAYGKVTTIAGNSSHTPINGTGIAASFYSINGIAMDAGNNLYVADVASHTIRMITPGGVVSTFAGSGTQDEVDGIGTAASFDAPRKIAIDASGNIYVTDNVGATIRMITPFGVVSTIAGLASNRLFANGPVASAKFVAPSGIALNGSSIYVVDLGAQSVRKIAGGNVSTFAGNADTPFPTGGFTNGTGTAATFNGPYDLTFDNAGNLFVTELGNKAIRKITPTGVVTTFAGTGTSSEGKLGLMRGITVDASNNLYVADAEKWAIEKITPAGIVSTVAGNGTRGSDDGIGNNATFVQPNGLVLDNAGSLYITDNNLIRKINLTGYSISPTALPAGLTFDSTTGIISGTPTEGTAATTYTITAYNTSGNSTASITLSGGIPPALPNLSYAAQTFLTDVPITPVYPTNTGGTVTFGYSISPVLPVGLFFNPGTGTISGTASQAAVTTNYSITSSNSSGSSTTTISITVLNANSPTITSFSPAAVARGQVVTITGTNFTDVTNVMIGGIAASSYKVVSPTTITVVATGSAKQDSVAVITQNGKAAINGFIALPSVSLLKPNNATAGNTITFTGVDFNGVSEIKFGTVPATSFKVVSQNAITVVVPLDAGNSINLTKAGTTITFPDFTYVSTPVVTANGRTTFSDLENVFLTGNPGSGFDCQWSKDLIDIPGANTASYIAETSGSYTMSILINGGRLRSAPVIVTRVLVLPPSNFKIAINSATCKGSNNGSITITPTRALNYTATITGNNTTASYPFVSAKTISDLVPGTYNICITVQGEPDYQQCFTAVVTQPKDLSVFTAVNENLNVLNMQMDGGETYNITLNGANYSTSNNSIALPLIKGDNKLTVATDKLCQGIIEKVITVSDKIVPYPDPFENVLNIKLGNNSANKASVNINSANNGGKLVYSKQFTNVAGNIQLDLANLKTGIYILTLWLDNTQSVYKILKK